MTSSPRYPQSNGQVVRMVQTVKRMIQKSQDPYLAVPSPVVQFEPTRAFDGEDKDDYPSDKGATDT